ncbi:MAG: hypothetical protein ACR2MX_20035 [Cyclobacteriaceae bacterium]
MHHNKQDSPPLHRVRPRFKVETSHSSEDLELKIKTALEEEDALCIGRIRHGFATIQLPTEQQHYWSPQLNVTLEETENGTLIRGLYGPRPAVWTMFIFFYSIIGFATMIIAMVGLSNLTLDKSGAILWLVPVLVLTFLSLYLVAYFGKKMGHDQMVTLQKFMEESTGLVLNEEQES